MRVDLSHQCRYGERENVFVRSWCAARHETGESSSSDAEQPDAMRQRETGEIPVRSRHCDRR